MTQEFQVFDFHRIFLGDAPPLFLLEIVFRTIIMYGYTIFLLRVLGKRGMGQLSTLELAIIISFGSAVGDPMVGAQVPILYGVVAISVITFLQIALERLINKNKRVEAFMEGEPNLVVQNGVIQWDCLMKDNLSKEDLFRSLRGKDIDHLGQIKKAFFETSGQISIMFQPLNKIKPGLSILPETIINESSILNLTSKVKDPGAYCCLNCGHVETLKMNENIMSCEVCNGEEWIKAVN